MRDLVIVGIGAAAVIAVSVLVMSLRGGTRFRVRGGPHPTPGREGISEPNRRESQLAIVPVIALLGDGGWLVIVAVVMIILGMAYGLFGRSSRQRINPHPMGDRRGSDVPAPGADEGGDPSGADRDAIRGTRHGTH